MFSAIIFGRLKYLVCSAFKNIYRREITHYLPTSIHLLIRCEKPRHKTRTIMSVLMRLFTPKITVMMVSRSLKGMRWIARGKNKIVTRRNNACWDAIRTTYNDSGIINSLFNTVVILIDYSCTLR